MQNDLTEVGPADPADPAIFQLPPEILEYSFLYAITPSKNDKNLDGEDVEQKMTGNVVYATRYRIMATCRRWRNITVEATHLWSNVTVKFANRIPNDGIWKPYDRMYPTVHLLRLVLERSGNRLLNLHLFGFTSPLNKWEDPVGVLRDAFSRCETLVLPEVDPPYLGLDFFTAPFSPFPHLKASICSFKSAKLLDFSLAPKLHTLSLTGSDFTLNNSASLVRLSLTYGNYSAKLIRLVSECINLRTLILRGYWTFAGLDPDGNTSPIAPLHLPHLLELEYGIHELSDDDEAEDEGPIMNLLDAIEAPQLEVLSVRSEWFWLRKGQFPKLATLMVGYGYGSYEIDRDSRSILLNAVSSITHLAFSPNWSFDRRLAMALSRRGVDGAFELLPSLRELTISAYEEDAVTILMEARGDSRPLVGEDEETTAPFMVHFEGTLDECLDSSHGVAVDKKAFVSPFDNKTWVL